MSKYISEWLVLGPISNKSYQSTPHGENDGHPVAKDIIEDIETSNFSPKEITSRPSGVPRDGDWVPYHSHFFDKGYYQWRALDFNVSNWDDLNEVGDNIHQKLDGFRDKHHALAFFLTFIQSPEQRETVLSVRSDDSLRVWLNGEELVELKFAGERDISAAEVEAKITLKKITLKKGWNLLLAAVAETHFEWGFSARIENEAELNFTTEKPEDAALAPGKRMKLSLEEIKEISNNYTVFEENQVLTHDQLNSITDYLDDQERLTRLNLLGVGIVGGLQVSLEREKGIVTVTKGVGVTTDGDLLYLPDNQSFERFRLYDESKPAYAPFYQNGDTRKMFPVYELISKSRETPGDASVKPLTDFGQDLGTMVVVLLMESSVTDRDICSATDCDNLGRVYQDIVRVLLIDSETATSLEKDREKALEPGRQKLKPLDIPEIKAERPLVGKNINTTSELLNLYLTVCRNIKEQIYEHLTALVLIIGKQVFPDAPPADWECVAQKYVEQFKNISNEFIEMSARDEVLYIQYYYDFLKDIAETWNALRAAILDAMLDGDDRLLCPSHDAFPKHLLLGRLSAPVYLRTSFYPSPLNGCANTAREHSRFLVRKLLATIETFAIPGVKFTYTSGHSLDDKQPSPSVVIIPSRGETVSLEERAIPYYYFWVAGDGIPDIRQLWNFRRSKHGDADRNLGYWYNKEDDSPLKYQIGQYDFFRIEGHLGLKVDAVKVELKKKIGVNNLPIALRTVLLGDPIIVLLRTYSPLWHEINTQLGNLQSALIPIDRQIKAYKPVIKNGTELAVKSRLITILKLLLTNIDNTINNLPPKDHSKYLSFRDLFNQIFIDKPEINTGNRSAPDTLFLYLDQLINTPLELPLEIAEQISQLREVIASITKVLPNWKTTLDQFDAHIKTEQQSKAPTFSNLVEIYPGLEHAGGVSRGGTFTLVYDEDNFVVADFMLPYYIAPEIEQQLDPYVLLPLLAEVIVSPSLIETVRESDEQGNPRS